MKSCDHNLWRGLHDKRHTCLEKHTYFVVFIIEKKNTHHPPVSQTQGTAYGCWHFMNETRKEFLWNLTDSWRHLKKCTPVTICWGVFVCMCVCLRNVIHTVCIYAIVWWIVCCAAPVYRSLSCFASCTSFFFIHIVQLHFQCEQIKVSFIFIFAVAMVMLTKHTNGLTLWRVIIVYWWWFICYSPHLSSGEENGHTWCQMSAKPVDELPWTDELVQFALLSHFYENGFWHFTGHTNCTYTQQ